MLFQYEGRWFWEITSPAGEFVASSYRGYGTRLDALNACTHLASGIWGDLVIRVERK